MEDKIIKKIKTSFPLPLYIYNTHVTYNEVRKASGVAYIVLELIKNNQDAKDKISYLLLKFGIPMDMHYIFGSEIANLLGTEILVSNYTADHFMNPKYFSEILISDIKLTAKGKKLFLEGAIPTGVEKIKVKEIYFSPVTRSFELSTTQNYSAFANSYLGEEFLDQVKVDISGMEDYINANTAKIGLKAEERMVSFTCDEPKKMQVRKEEGLNIIIRNSGVEFAFDTTDETVFFLKYYTLAQINEGMLLKNKYKFVDHLNELLNVPTVDISELGDLSNVYIPADTQKQANRPCKIFINKNRLGIGRDNACVSLASDISTCLLNIIDDKAEFALLDSSGIKYYSALNVSMPCEKLKGKFEIQLLVERRADSEKSEQVLNKMFEIYCNREFDEDASIVIPYIAEYLKDKNYYNQYIKFSLFNYKSVDEKIQLLMKLHFAFAKNSLWVECFKEYAVELFVQSIEEIKLDNMIYKNTVLSPLKEFLGISTTDYISKFAYGIAQTEDSELVYQALETAGFLPIEILSVVNVVEKYMGMVLDNRRILSDTELADKYNVLLSNMWNLNKMLGIESYDNYTLTDNYGIDEFFNAYATTKNAVKEVEKYRTFATKEYDLLDKYLKIYEPIHELLSLERSAASHPSNITDKYITANITRGKFKEVICDLLLKLQFNLREILKVANTVQANELIDNASAEKIITNDQANKLHKLRMCRNSFQHPEGKQVAFDINSIVEWRDLVFSIKESK